MTPTDSRYLFYFIYYRLYMKPTQLGVFGIGPRCRPWPPIRDFDGTPLSTEWFSHLPTKVGLPSVHWPLYEKVVDT